MHTNTNKKQIQIQLQIHRAIYIVCHPNNEYHVMNKVMNMITDQTHFIFTVSDKSSINMKQIFDNDKAIQTKSFVIVKL